MQTSPFGLFFEASLSLEVQGSHLYKTSLGTLYGTHSQRGRQPGPAWVEKNGPVKIQPSFWSPSSPQTGTHWSCHWLPTQATTLLCSLGTLKAIMLRPTEPEVGVGPFMFNIIIHGYLLIVILLTVSWLFRSSSLLLFPLALFPYGLMPFFGVMFPFHCFDLLCIYHTCLLCGFHEAYIYQYQSILS